MLESVLTKPQVTVIPDGHHASAGWVKTHRFFTFQTAGTTEKEYVAAFAGKSLHGSRTTSPCLAVKSCDYPAHQGPLNIFSLGSHSRDTVEKVGASGLPFKLAEGCVTFECLAAAESTEREKRTR